MPVEFFDYKGEIAYREKPYEISPEYAKEMGKFMKLKQNEELHNNGWSKDKQFRYAGSIPKEVWYEQIRLSGDPNYWQYNKGVRMRQWLNNNSAFRIGGKM